MARVLSLPIIGNIINTAHFYEGGARGDASVMGIWDPSRPRVSRALKSHKRVRMAKTPHNDRLFGRIGRPISVGGPPATNAHDVEV